MIKLGDRAPHPGTSLEASAFSASIGRRVYDLPAVAAACTNIASPNE